MTSHPLHTVLVPGLACSARLYGRLIPCVWEYGAATVADTRRDHSIGAIAERLLADADENHGNSPESIIEIPHLLRAAVGH
jgi:hypothetical protein